MFARADDTHAAKRRRLNLFNDNQTQATQPYLSLDGTHAHFPESRRPNNGEATPTNGAGFATGLTITPGHERLSKVEQEPPECCYGMVRRKMISIQRDPREANN
jgi:hypothetical protein